MSAFLAFGDTRPEYPVPVLNEREARAGAGILLLVALIAFSNAFLKGDFLLTRMVIMAFTLDFAIRVLVNPRFAPSLVLGRYMVRKQAPEFVGAAQKRFAWSIGLVIALGMSVWVIGLNLAGPVAILGCLACIAFLFFETAFGICIGCKVYAIFWPEKAQLCPGGACAVTTRDPATHIAPLHLVPVALLAGMLIVAFPMISSQPAPRMFPGLVGEASAQDCTVPEFAKRMGHEAQWKLHNGCK